MDAGKQHEVGDLKSDAVPTRKSFLLRVDPALWAELEKWAAADLRSVNGQVEWILRQAVEKRKGK